MPNNHTTTSSPPNPEILARRPSTPGLRQQLFDKIYLATGKIAFPWQLDVAESLCKRRDVMCIAGTGKGETLAFVMYFVDSRVLIWIVSPLNYIQKQQEKQFRDEWNIPACNVNATTSYPGLHKLPVTIIFIDLRKLGFEIFKMLFDHLPKELKDQIEI
ncbi:hypothetical protein RSAG8_08930, partial [Rhizoctonia solani AG-8 WAC10335]